MTLPDSVAPCAHLHLKAYKCGGGKRPFSAGFTATGQVQWRFTGGLRRLRIGPGPGACKPSELEHAARFREFDAAVCAFARTDAGNVGPSGRTAEKAAATCELHWIEWGGSREGA